MLISLVMKVDHDFGDKLLKLLNKVLSMVSKLGDTKDK